MIINRKDPSVSVDRIDANWWIPEPFLGQRDYFYIEKADKEAILNKTATHSRMAFVRHTFWRHKLEKVPITLWSNLSAWSYKKAFKG